MPIRFNLQDYKNQIFIETGTYKGKGVQKALDVGFEKVISIEIDKERYLNCKKLFANEKKVELYLGDTQDLLPKILSKYTDNTITFWLDAHEGKKSKKSCPLYEELEAISKHPIKNHIIAIDDIRLIKDKHAWQGHSVTIDGLKKKILQINSKYNFCFKDGIIENDVLISYVKT